MFTRSFRHLGVPLVDPIGISAVETDLTEIRPLERRADTVLKFDTEDEGSYILVIESQSKKDPAKHGAWAYYLSHLHERYHVPVVLLVTCNDEATAQWAETQYHIGLPQWRSLTLRPLVLGPHNVPLVTEPEIIAADLPGAVFSAMTHSKHSSIDTMLKVLAEALKDAGEEATVAFGELVASGIGPQTAAGQVWSDLMSLPTSFFKSEWSQELFDRFRTEGRAAGLAEARADDIFRTLRIRGIPISDADRDRVTECTDPDTLGLWHDRAVLAERAQDIFVPASTGDGSQDEREKTA